MARLGFQHLDKSKLKQWCISEYKWKYHAIISTSVTKERDLAPYQIWDHSVIMAILP